MSVSGYAFEWFTDRLFTQIEVFAIKLSMYCSLESMFHAKKRCLLSVAKCPVIHFIDLVSSGTNNNRVLFERFMSYSHFNVCKTLMKDRKTIKPQCNYEQFT